MHGSFTPARLGHNGLKFNEFEQSPTSEKILDVINVPRPDRLSTSLPTSMVLTARLDSEELDSSEVTRRRILFRPCEDIEDIVRTL